jgi:hypothetical protein
MTTLILTHLRLNPNSHSADAENKQLQTYKLKASENRFPFLAPMESYGGNTSVRDLQNLRVSVFFSSHF